MEHLFDILSGNRTFAQNNRNPLRTVYYSRRTSTRCWPPVNDERKTRLEISGYFLSRLCIRLTR